MTKQLTVVALGVLLVSGGSRPVTVRSPVGIFTGSADIGTPSAPGPGSALYDSVTKTYTLSRGGENMWAAADQFHYAWTKVSGDLTLEAAVQFVETPHATGAANPHRKDDRKH